MLTPGADPVRKVSIIPRGQALGRDVPDARRPTATATRRSTCAAASSARSAAAPPRRSSTATSPPAPRATWTRSPASPARWSAGGACPTPSGPVSVLPPPGQESPARPRRRRAGHQGARRPRGPADRRRVLRRGGRHAAAHREQLDRLAHALLDEGDARRGRRVRRRRASPRDAPPASAPSTNRADLLRSSPQQPPPETVRAPEHTRTEAHTAGRLRPPSNEPPPFPTDAMQ